MKGTTRTERLILLEARRIRAKLNEMAAGEGWHALKIDDLRAQALDLGIDPLAFGRNKRALAQAIEDAGGSISLPASDLDVVSKPVQARQDAGKGLSKIEQMLIRGIEDVESDFNLLLAKLREDYKNYRAEFDRLKKEQKRHQFYTSRYKELESLILEVYNKMFDAEIWIQKTEKDANFAIKSREEKLEKARKEREDRERKVLSKESGKIFLEDIWRGIEAFGKTLQEELKLRRIEISFVKVVDGLPYFHFRLSDLPGDFYKDDPEGLNFLKAAAAKKLESTAKRSVERLTGRGSVKLVEAGTIDPYDHEVDVTVYFAKPTIERPGTKKFDAINAELKQAVDARLPRSSW